ncbi:uncharacterized protein [Nicotiana sylvestris]|uniref:Uncharacterized protein isoform X1 n=2 Tax=Nicotiana TaxID=4085 RepID=A0A1S4BYI0_TOBAC|nr:PREDICTED: uncharacterized protein LOC104231974 isoform X1 [Nicotiana sylvestris]XP_016493844.1 PREDICTED: uncharacterized protein LOC107813139 isoform X1 [Nicotiana tabacum]
MKFFIGKASTLHSHHHQFLLYIISPQSNYINKYYPNFITKRWLNTGTESTQSEFPGPNAYELLGVSETSSFAEIKDSFRKLAKETHPDLLPLSTPNSSSTSKQFVDILAAYEILSDSEKRAHYDQYLSARKTLVHVHSRQGSKMCMYESYSTSIKEMEVVEWLKWYRQTVNDILAEKRVVSGSGYFDALERDFYSALHLAFYGPEIESDLLPECFEAEERSVYETAEVLHLVFGRDLFGMVCFAKNVPELSHASREKLTSFTPGLGHSIENLPMKMHPETAHTGSDQRQLRSSNYHTSDAYRNLELHVGRRLVAVATRVPPRSRSNGIQNEGFDDCIHVYLNSDEVQRFSKSNFINFGLKSAVPLGMITGLGTSPEEGSCDVYDNNGLKTHVIMKHRTLLVRHMHWYRLGDEVSTCECRCRRARLPPSKFWLFEPRCGMHDIGGWYVETFGRDKKGRNVLSQRYWDGLGANDHFEKRLHPAMYLLALAYRTLDIEDSRRSKQRMKDLVESNISRILSWCKRLVH